MRLFKCLPYLAIVCLAPVASGCGNIQADRCDSVCSCENCGERELQQCEIDVDADYSVAETYGCLGILEPYWECQLQRHECDDNHYSDDNDECDREHREYKECLDAQSTREGGPY